MLLQALREEVLEANLELVRRGLVLYTFGNVSGIDRGQGLVAIKPSGVAYADLTPEKIVISDLEGKIVDGALRPSSDLATHLELYKHFGKIGGVAHTHSEYATAWAQAEMEIPCFGTTHADYFQGRIPVTALLSTEAIAGDYERETGLAICRRFRELDPEAMPAALVAGHGPFCWGASAAEAAHNAVILEYVARVGCHTVSINAEARPLQLALRDRHFLRKHGGQAYYGQANPEPKKPAGEAEAETEAKQ
ncbi:MAG: L-ribulose-5-phosphate 4-epimerase AraD [Terracidiphilus sp.]|jgi:L-ribulose-5-phosphate 4-epimerase